LVLDRRLNDGSPKVEGVPSRSRHSLIVIGTPSKSVWSTTRLPASGPAVLAV
jgi:hypothetical protein